MWLGMADATLLSDAHDLALKCVAILENVAPENMTIYDVANAQMCVFVANAKLTEYQCQMTGQSAKMRG